MRRNRSAGYGVAVVALVLAAAFVLAGCSAATKVLPGPKYTNQQLSGAWMKHPESANWSMEVRDVITQRKSTGSHKANYTVFLVTYTPKSVPEFKLYGSVDIPPDDSMTFEERANAFFDSLAAGSEFSGVQDREAFMSYFAGAYPKKCFVRLMQNTDGSGTSTWEVVATDKPPTESAMTIEAKSGIVLAYDDETKIWSKKK